MQFAIFFEGYNRSKKNEKYPTTRATLPTPRTPGYSIYPEISENLGRPTPPESLLYLELQPHPESTHLFWYPP